jgi:hypothetical protein
MNILNLSSIERPTPVQKENSSSNLNEIENQESNNYPITQGIAENENSKKESTEGNNNH